MAFFAQNYFHLKGLITKQSLQSCNKKHQRVQQFQNASTNSSNPKIFVFVYYGRLG